MGRQATVLGRVCCVRFARCVVAVCAVLVGSACTPVADGSASGPPERTLTVFAAASLTDVFRTWGAQFAEQHPGTTVEFAFAGSSALAEQLAQGAPADVFASADQATMDRVVADVGVADEPVVFARNTLQIAVPPENPAGIGSLDDLAADGTTVALCAEHVPCGAASRAVLDAAGVAVDPVTWEEDVRAALTRVRLGEVDAALVYRSDVVAAGGDVHGIDIPEAAAAVNDYPIAVLADAAEPELAQAWTAFVTSPDNAKVLDDAGFLLP
ncbi:MAG: molybdate ABC transporter substrate-binding protein [Thermobifida sp.]|nr:molybdate ABC transporter substrate-binding protein [Thermobifida sp.]PZN63628.1 MAG: molybdate ABC transporter substrate-binding protein [Thermobifida fusca]